MKTKLFGDFRDRKLHSQHILNKTDHGFGNATVGFNPLDDFSGSTAAAASDSPNREI